MKTENWKLENELGQVQIKQKLGFTLIKIKLVN